MSTAARPSELAASFEQPGAEVWMVLADELQARGDPRGELIGIEQRLDGLAVGPEREALEARRSRLYKLHEARWVGREFAEARARLASPDATASVLTWTMRYGYLLSLHVDVGLDVDGFDALADVLDCEAARFLSRLTIDAAAGCSWSLADALARDPRPIRELSLLLSHICARDPELIREEQAIRLCDALPELRSMTLVGRALFEDFPHPALERLQIRGHDAIIGLGLWTELPRLWDLDLANMSGSFREPVLPRGPDHARRTELLSGDGLPALRRLDLSHNATGCRPDSIYLGGRVADELFEELLDAPVLERLDELVLPLPPSTTHVELMYAAPRVARIACVRMPYTYFGLDERARQRSLPQLEVGIVYPHRRVSDVHGREVMKVSFGDSHTVWLGMRRLLELMELRYFGLSNETRRALANMLEAFDPLVYWDDTPGDLFVDLPYATFDETLHQLCDGFDDADTYLGDVLDPLSRLRGQFDCIRLSKAWGW